MQPLRGTKDILPNEIIFWQYIYNIASKILSLSNYQEIRTPIIEQTSLFKRSIGNGTDIVNKEMYSFTDQSTREITMRPEGTASIARAFISNNLSQSNKIHRLWYMGPMFRYERPQNGRQRQFHQLGIECIGSTNPMADTEVIRIAHSLLKCFTCNDYHIEINSIGNVEERNKYKTDFLEYLLPYQKDLDIDSQKRLNSNPLRILDTKNIKTKEILSNAPSLNTYLEETSKKHFETVLKYLDCLNIKYNINTNLVRGLDYYNYTAFEIKSNSLSNQDTICGGGRYDSLIKQLGGPNTPAVGWAIGVERLLLTIQQQLNLKQNDPLIYLATQGLMAQQKVWSLISILENQEISFELNLDNNSFQKQLKKADQSGALICIILGDDEIINQSITIKWLDNRMQEKIDFSNLSNFLNKLKMHRYSKDKYIHKSYQI